MKKDKGSLLALGSAAVLAVYAAGFVRTRPAAQRFEGAEAERRPAHPVPPTAEQPVVTAPKKPVPTVPRKPKAVVAPATSAPKPDSMPSAPSSPPAPPEPAPVVVAITIPDSVPESVQPVDSGVSIAVGPDSVERGRFKDGTYTGWGSSRHGDIEAGVDIRDGRIVSAYITQCLTRYSCSWISRLPPQVVDRQGPDVDTVSRATQSSDAFYYAVFNALAKAK